MRRLLGVPIVVAAVVAALAAPVGAAEAAVAGSTTKPAAVSGSGSGSNGGDATTAASGTSSGAATSPGAKHAMPVKPAAPPKPKAAATVSPDTARKLRSAAAAHALATTTVPNTCSGAIQPDTIYPCTGTAGPDTFTAQLTSTHDVLLIQSTTASGGSAFVSVTGPDGNAVPCQQYNAPPWQCSATAAGTYTILVTNSGNDFTLDYRALLADTSCASANTSFAAPDIQGSLAAGSVGDCYQLSLPAGSVLAYQVSGEPIYIYDATGQQQCTNAGNCTLGGAAPYRVAVSETYAAAATYTLRLTSLSNPQGCVTANQLTYGQVPDSSSAIRCRSITVPSTGPYRIYAVWDGSSPISTLYNLDGSVACTNAGPNCDLTAGTYSFVMFEDLGWPTIPFGVVFMAAGESRGCVATGDTGFATGPATGTFTGVGEEVCLTLPTASGKSDYVLDEPTADRSFPPLQVVDATGAQQCEDQYYLYTLCALSGTAPFRLILSDVGSGAAYQELVQRTDSAAGCAAWPQSGFGGSWGVQASLTPSAPAACLSIPASAHSVGEMLDYTNTANKVNAAVYVNDPTGKQICLGNSLAFCSYQSGVAYTALLMTSNNLTDTYKLVRRDVSSTAPCAAPASTTVGGPSSQLLLASDLDAACFHVAAATTDRWWTDVRAVGPDKSGAALAVTDPTGKIVCRQWGVSCNVTGSTGYQVVVIASGYSGVAIPAHVDVWRVGTASGWASQCTAHKLSVSGFPVQSGTLTDNSTAYCAVMPMQPSQGIGVYGFDSGVGVDTVAINMYLPGNWGNGLGLCQQSNVGSFVFDCATQSNDPAGDAVFLVTPGSAPAPVSYTMQGVTCKFSCSIPPAQATISAVSPAQGPVGTDQITVTGTNLTMGTRVYLASNGTNATGYFSESPVSVNAAGTSLTVQIGTFGLPPRVYDVVLDSPGYSTGTPSPGYLPNAFTLTAAPPPPPAGLLVPVGPKRILDTRQGQGAPQAPVAAGGAVKLKVSGVAGVPASGVTAVVMNVTVTGATSGGYVTVFPDGTPRPAVSTVNFTAGQTIPNLVTVPVVNGNVDLYNGSTGTLNLIADITGYYTSAGPGSALNAVGPTRILDTRHGIGAPQAPVPVSGTVKLQVDGVAGVPASGVTAVVMNVTVTGATVGGYVTVYPDSMPRPTVSNLNFHAGQTIPNLVVVPVVNGMVDLYNGSGGTLNLIADITGYYASTGAAYHPAGPALIMDTRNGLGGAGGVIPAGSAAVLPVYALLGYPGGNVTSVALNVTVTAPVTGGYLTVYPDSVPRPTASNLNFSAGQTISNLVIVPVVDGKVVFYNGTGGTVQVVADTEGYFAS